MQAATQRPVAVKTIRSSADAAARARFAREARLGGRLRHPHLVTVLDAGETAEGEPWLVMELVEGETLEQVGSRGRPPLADALACFAAIADGVRFAHQNGVMHRDLKPGNILCTADGGVRILDFGLAKALDEVAPDPHTTLAGTFVGTLACAAPEQLRCDGTPVDARTDLFQLGVVFYRHLTGAWPHPPEPDPRTMLARRLHDVPMRPSRLRPDLPPDGDTIVLRLLAAEPERRYATANELHADLERLRRGEPIAARAEQATVRLVRLVGRYRVAAVASVAAVLVLVVAVVVVLGYARRAETDRTAIAHEFARAEELLGILTRSMDAFGAGEHGPKTPMVDFLDRVVVELEARPTVDVQGRVDLLRRAAELYARIADPQRAARFVARAVGLLGEGADADAVLLLRAHEMRLRLAAALPDPTLAAGLPPLLAALEHRFGADAEPVLWLRILELVALRADREPAAAFAELHALAARIDATEAALRERLRHPLDCAWVSVAAAAGACDEALERARNLLARPVGTGWQERVHRFAMLRAVSTMAMDCGEMELADATTAEGALLAVDVALPTDPRRAAALFARGLCLVRLGQVEAAAEPLREFVRLVAEGAPAEARMVAPASVLLASAAEANGALGEAVDHLVRARGALQQVGAAGEGDLLQVEYQLGVLLERDGRAGEAVPVLEAALARAQRLDGAGDPGGRIAALEALLARLRSR
jgi:tetratricopeptide (TPR) repeat protein